MPIINEPNPDTPDAPDAPGQNTAAFAGGGGVAPSPPTGLAVGTLVLSVPLTWSSVAGVTGYRIYRDAVTTPVYDGTALTYTDITTNAVHTYQVTAYNGAGESINSSAVSAGSGGTATSGSGAVINIF